jgi:hypothetical protein
MRVELLENRSTAYGGSIHSGQVTTFDTNIGYNFKSYLGVDAGIPMYFVRTPSFFSSNRDLNRGWMNGLGDPYIDVRFNGTTREINLPLGTYWDRAHSQLP